MIQSIYVNIWMILALKVKSLTPSFSSHHQHIMSGPAYIYTLNTDTVLSVQ